MSSVSSNLKGESKFSYLPKEYLCCGKKKKEQIKYFDDPVFERRPQRSSKSFLVNLGLLIVSRIDLGNPCIRIVLFFRGKKNQKKKPDFLQNLTIFFF